MLGSVIGGAIGAVSQARTNRQNQANKNRDYRLQRQQAEHQMGVADWQKQFATEGREREDNVLQRKVADAEQAGIHKHMLMGGGAGGGAGGAPAVESSGGQTSAGSHLQDPAQGAAMGANSMANIASTGADIAYKKHQGNHLQAVTQRIDYEVEHIRMQVSHGQASIEHMNTQMNHIAAEIRHLGLQDRHLDQQHRHREDLHELGIAHSELTNMNLRQSLYNAVIDGRIKHETLRQEQFKGGVPDSHMQGNIGQVLGRIERAFGRGESPEQVSAYLRREGYQVDPALIQEMLEAYSDNRTIQRWIQNNARPTSETGE